MMSGPLDGLGVVELAGIGPAPFCGMVLADMGADVIRVDRVEAASGSHHTASRHDLLNRGKRSIAVDLKREEGVEIVLGLVERRHALIEGFRPGVTERIGLGPETCLARNTSLVYGRMTGWGREGPLSAVAGHDVDFIAVSGALGSIGDSSTPVIPLNLVGDYGGGGLLLAFGLVSAILAVRDGGPGQVVDAAMVDGSALLMTSHHGYMAEGWWIPRRASNPLDGGAPYYTTYPTADGGHMAVGAIEPHFYSELLRVLGLDPELLPAQSDRSGWPILREEIASRFATRSRDEWEEAFAGIDACVAPVLDMAEATEHPHNRERGTFVDVEGITQPGPAPRFSVTVPAVRHGPAHPGEHTTEILESLGYSPREIGMLQRSQIVA